MTENPAPHVEWVVFTALQALAHESLLFLGTCAGVKGADCRPNRCRTWPRGGSCSHRGQGASAAATALRPCHGAMYPQRSTRVHVSRCVMVCGGAAGCVWVHHPRRLCRRVRGSGPGAHRDLHQLLYALCCCPTPGPRPSLERRALPFSTCSGSMLAFKFVLAIQVAATRRLCLEATAPHHEKQMAECAVLVQSRCPGPQHALSDKYRPLGVHPCRHGTVV